MISVTEYLNGVLLEWPYTDKRIFLNTIPLGTFCAIGLAKDKTKTLATIDYVIPAEMRENLPDLAPLNAWEQQFDIAKTKIVFGPIVLAKMQTIRVNY